MLRGCVGVCAALLAVTAAAAQTQQDPPKQDRRAQITAVIERALESRQRIRLAADRITLTGDVLRLTGKVRITLGTDTLIQAEEATIDRGAGKVELVGDVRAWWGPSLPLPLPRPRIEYR